MGIEAYGGYDSEALDRFGKNLLEKYDVMACEAAERLNETSLTDDSLRSYKPQIRQIVHSAGTDNPEIEDVLQHISDCDKKARTKNMMVMAAKKYYQVIGEYQKANDFMEQASRERDDIGYGSGMDVKHWLTTDEVDRVIENLCPTSEQRNHIIEWADKAYIIDHQHKALFASLYYTGCRVGEVVKLKYEDFYFDTNEVKVYRLKKKGPEIPRDMIAVPNEYMEIMKDYFDHFGIDEGKVFDFTTRTAENRITDLHNVYEFTMGEFKHADKLEPHVLRHSRVTAIANHAGVESAGEYVNHSSLEITKGYRHLSTQEQRKMLPEEQTNQSEETAFDKELMEELGFDSVEEMAAYIKGTQQAPEP